MITEKEKSTASSRGAPEHAGGGARRGNSEQTSHGLRSRVSSVSNAADVMETVPRTDAAGAPRKPLMAVTTGVSAKSRGHAGLAPVQEEEEVMESNGRCARSESRC